MAHGRCEENVISQLTEIQKPLDDIRALMDDSSASLASILRRAAKVAGLVGDSEHRDLFLLHLEGVIYSSSAGPRHAPWQDPNWKPRWDVRMAFMDDRTMPEGKIMAFPLEELEHNYRRLREEGSHARERGDTEGELRFFDLEADCEKILFRIRRRVDTFLQLADNWLILQKNAETKNNPVHPMGGAIFIGHGRSPVWRELKDFVSERLGLPCVEFNSDSAAGKTTVQRLSEMLDTSCFAFLIMTAEDEHADSTLHARENVIHEVGLFQGRLGFSRAIVMLEVGCSEFSNITGLTHIPYPQGKIMTKCEDIRRVLEREGLISPSHAP